MAKKTKSKAEKKLTAEQLQGLLHMRKRGYAVRNAKAYKRHNKHKGKESD